MGGPGPGGDVQGDSNTIPPSTANGIIRCILFAGSATYCENEPEERGDLLFLNCLTFITFQIRSIKPRVQNVLDTLETVIIDLSKSYFCPNIGMR